jgi:hypothetical protein
MKVEVSDDYDAIFAEFGYAEYLEIWEGAFGGRTEITRQGKINGTLFTFQVSKLTEEQFNGHKAALVPIYQEIAAALEAAGEKDWDALDRKWLEALRHEVHLLL